jgi:hypothetical protein
MANIFSQIKQLFKMANDFIKNDQRFLVKLKHLVKMVNDFL